MADSINERWQRIPLELRQRPQWCVAGPDKRPLTADGRPASSKDPTTWTDFDTACQSAAAQGRDIGYMQSADDPFACIDMDVKDGTAPEALARYQSVIDTCDSYTERSRSGRGFHVWVKGKIGTGRRRDGVEMYSQERFMICTGNVVREGPIAERQELLTNMVAQMSQATPADAELWGEDCADWSVASRAAEDGGELGRLFAGDWEGRYPSQSEADLALVKLLLPLTESPQECWQTFRLSKLGAREKAKRADYAQSTVALAAQQLADDAAQLQHGQSMADSLFESASAKVLSKGAVLLDRLSIDWTGDDDADVPDIIAGLVADEDVTMLGGHGGVGKSLLAMQMACAAALGEPILGCSTRQCRVLYYSAEDGRKRLTRRLRRVAETFDYDADLLRENLRVLDASEVEPLYGESVSQAGGRSTFAKVLGPRVDFDNLSAMVETFDPQLVIIDGASDTFDGNEIARREVRAFIKMLRRVHPHRNIGVMLLVHIDRSSARGFNTNDDGYAGSAQWHNSCRRRMFLQHQVKRDPDDREAILTEAYVLRVMKNQDGPPAPDMELQRGEWGLWQCAVEIGGDLSPESKVDHGPTIARLIAKYYQQGHFMSTSLAPQATTGIYPTLKGDPDFPKGLNRKRTAEIVRDLKRTGVLVEEPYQRPNRSYAERWVVMRDPDCPFERAAPTAQTGTE